MNFDKSPIHSNRYHWASVSWVRGIKHFLSDVIVELKESICPYALVWYSDIPGANIKAPPLAIHSIRYIE